jgi:hypothetical protein
MSDGSNLVSLADGSVNEIHEGNHYGGPQGPIKYVQVGKGAFEPPEYSRV